MSLLAPKKKVKKEKPSQPVADKSDAPAVDVSTEKKAKPAKKSKDKKVKTEKKAKPAKSKDKKSSKNKKKVKKSSGEKKSRKPRGNNKMSALAAAELVLQKNGNKPLSAMQLIESMTKKGFWKTPSGKTPDRTLNSAIIREIAEGGKKSKFVKVDRGQYKLRS